jgi:hypothetical protein
MSLVFLLSLVGAEMDPLRSDLGLPRMLTEGCTPAGVVNHVVSLYFLALLQCFIVLCHFYMLLICRITFTIYRIPFKISTVSISLQYYHIVSYFAAAHLQCLLFHCIALTVFPVCRANRWCL